MNYNHSEEIEQAQEGTVMSPAETEHFLSTLTPIKNREGEQIGHVEALPNGLFTAFDFASKMRFTGRTKAKAVEAMTGRPSIRRVRPLYNVHVPEVRYYQPGIV